MSNYRDNLAAAQAQNAALVVELERTEPVKAPRKISPAKALVKRLVDAVYETPTEWTRLEIKHDSWRRYYEYVTVWCLRIRNDPRESVHARYLAVWRYSWCKVVVAGVFTKTKGDFVAYRWGDDLSAYLTWRDAWRVKKALKELPALKAQAEMETIDD